VHHIRSGAAGGVIRGVVPRFDLLAMRDAGLRR
jgi:hypothetical protein